MKTVIKNVLLGSVAGLAMVGTAAAADLPVKAKAAEYVKVCSTYGAGFYYIPGSDTCLKIGGFVQVDYYYNDFSAQPSDTYTETYFKARGALRADARTQTEYGTLRSFFELRMTYGDSDNNYTENHSPNLDKAYIQFAGFTFGKVQSFYDYYADDFIIGIDSVEITSDENAIVAAYTADFGNGFTATLSIEDDTTRSNGIYSAFTPYSAQQGDLPAFVANINYEGEWGGFQVAGVIRQLSDRYYTGYTGDDVGWGVLGGVKFNLPALGDGDTLYLEVAYADGATSYTGIAGAVDLSTFSEVADVYFNPTTGRFEAAKAWTVAGAYQHFFSSTVAGTVYANYGELDVPNAAWDADASGFSLFNVGANLIWTPVKNLSFTAQYTYSETNYDSAIVNGFGNWVDSTNANQVLISVRRSF